MLERTASGHQLFGILGLLDVGAAIVGGPDQFVSRIHGRPPNLTSQPLARTLEEPNHSL